MRKQGDVSRKRKLVGPEAKRRWYARHRAERFARRYWTLGARPACTTSVTAVPAA